MERRKIGMVLNVPHELFFRRDQERFIEDLAYAVGCLPEDVRNPRFWTGCVKFEADIDSAAASYLLELFLDRKSRSVDEDVPASVRPIMDFLEKYKITNIEDGGLSAKLVAKLDKSKDMTIFVHGWRGNRDSFGKLPDIIENEADVRSIVYEYPTQATGRAPSILFVARNLENFVRNAITDEKQRVIFVAHSMGGLVVRRALANQIYLKNPLDQRLRQVTFIASPSTGVWLAKLSKLAGGIQSVQTSELGPDSSVLTDLIQNWNAWVDRLGDRKSIIRSVYGTADDVVDPAIAVGSDPEAIPILGAHHTDICRPENGSHEVVQTILRLLRETK